MNDSNITESQRENFESEMHVVKKYISMISYEVKNKQN